MLSVSVKTIYSQMKEAFGLNFRHTKKRKSKMRNFVATFVIARQRTRQVKELPLLGAQ